MKLRGYQERALSTLDERFREHRSVVAVAPAGSGKTVIGAAYVHRHGRRVLWVAHRRELLDQARDHLLAAGLPESDVGIVGGGKRVNPDARVVVASVFKRELPEADLVVVDEAHRVAAKSYQRLLSMDARILGLTATPWRLDGKPLSDAFESMAEVAGPAELIADGWLTSPIVYGIPQERAQEMVKGVRVAGDFAVGQLGQAMMKPKLMGDTVAEAARLAPGERTIVFASSKEHGRELFDRFRRAGRPSAYLDDKSPKGERRARLADLRDGTVEVLVNVDLFSEGFDCPPVKCIVLARPTRSLSRYLQQTGRGLRPFDGKRPIILDHAGNAWRHHLPHVEREWSLDGREKREGDAPVKLCVACGAIIPGGVRACRECGAEQPMSAQEAADERARLDRMRAREEDRERWRERLREVAPAEGGEKWVEERLRELEALP